MGKFQMLKSVRMMHGKTQAEVAEILDISPAAYNRKEQGKKEFYIEECEVLSEYFNMRFEKLFRREEDKLPRLKKNK